MRRTTVPPRRSARTGCASRGCARCSGLSEAIVVGSGPNGLAAAITLARAGLDVVVHEAAERVGGGMRTEELTLPGFRHDVCSAIHPLARSSSFFRELELCVEWIESPAAVAPPPAHEEAGRRPRGAAGTPSAPAPCTPR